MIFVINLTLWQQYIIIVYYCYRIIISLQFNQSEIMLIYMTFV